MPTTRTVYTDETDSAVTLEFEITATTSPFDPGCTYGPPENCYPPEGGEIEEIASISLIGYATHEGNLLSALPSYTVKLIEDGFRFRIENDEDFGRKIEAQLFDAMMYDPYDPPNMEWGDV